MTLTITLDLPADVEAELRLSIAQRDTARIRQVLTEALTPAVEALFTDTSVPAVNDHEWNALADQLIDSFAQAIPGDLPVLSEAAATRAGICEEHA